MNKRTRWTILDVDESIIAQVKKYANRKGYLVGRAVEELLSKGLSK